MRDGSPFVLVLTTWPADVDPAPIARALVDDGLAACVSILEPMRSIYRWQGAIEESRERQVIAKTGAAQVDALAARIAGLHPYEVPELLVLPVKEGSEKYLQWMAESLGPGGGAR